ncbi:MAG: helicase C-terminal domain-containing protein [Planctomycetota bacterium]
MPKHAGDARESFSPEARATVADEIRAAGGNEVFFFGSLTGGRVTSVEVVARGNARAVPVFLDRAGDHDVLIHNHPSGVLTPSKADLEIASEAGLLELGFFIVDNAVERVYRAVEPSNIAAEVRLDEAEISAIFAPGGLLATQVPNFEFRAGQRDMALAVTRAFNDRRVAATEAGTGVGKSFAYLVPAILWAVRNRQRIVVSTATIALSEQLVQKDLPLLARVLPVEFRFALQKGRGNYACKRKTADVRKNPELFGGVDERGRWVSEILARLETAREGSLADFDRSPPSDIWSDFQSTTEQTLSKACTFYNECHYYNARRAAIGANILVVNHHLLFSDLALRRASPDRKGDLVLPQYRRVVFDEAHRLEEIAAEHLGGGISRLAVLQGLGRLLGSARENGELRGRLPYLLSVLRSHDALPAGRFIEERLFERVQAAREGALEVFEDLAERISASVATVGSGSAEDSTLVEPTVVATERAEPAPAATEATKAPASAAVGTFRIGSRAGEVAFDAMRDPLLALREELIDLRLAIREGWTLLQDAPFEPQQDFDGALAEYRAAFRSVENYVLSIEQFLAPADGMLPWVELQERRGRNISLRVAPVRVAATLNDELYAQSDTVVMASATLSVAGKWDFLADRLGWNQTESRRFQGQSFASPFDFQRQAVLALTSDLPAPDHSHFERAFAAHVIELAQAARGRTFVLFTSHQLLRGVASRVAGPLEQAGLPLLVQGTAPPSELLRRFRAAGNAVLLGNMSFWEGVDVPGDALSCVVIARLPFRVPTHPLELGRAEELEARGENPFVRMTVPQAVLTLKQGFGRLVRTATDRGVVVIADHRVSTRPYGRRFLESLPPCRVERGTAAEMVEVVRRFFADGAPGVAESQDAKQETIG